LKTTWQYVSVNRLWLEGDRIGMRWIGAVAGELEWAHQKWKTDPIIPDAFDTWAFGKKEELSQAEDLLRVKDYPLFKAPAVKKDGRKLANKATFIVTLLSEPDIPIGIMVWYDIDHKKREFWIRKYLSDEPDPKSPKAFKYRKHGYAREMNVLAAEFAFRCMGFNRIRSGVKMINPQSTWTNLSCGFEITARIENHFFVREKLIDSVELELTREKWDRAMEHLKKHRNVGRIEYDVLENANGRLSERRRQKLPSCIQIADILQFFSPSYK
jgi:RimJ/RimL family protein N-acetyltransferase